MISVVPLTGEEASYVPSTRAGKSVVGSNVWSTQSGLLPCHMSLTGGAIVGLCIRSNCALMLG